MNQARIYYLISTGAILVITSECQGCVEKTTKEQDMAIYEQLKDKTVDEIDFIELEYGTLASTFNNVKSYSINLETKTLDVVYLMQEELQVTQTQEQEIQDLNSRISDISTYLTEQNNQSISDIEDYILQSEQNKILNGGM